MGRDRGGVKAEFHALIWTFFVHPGIDMQLPRQVAPPHKWYEMDIAESELTNESLSDMEEEEAELAEKLAREQYVEKLKAMETNYENVKRESGEDEQEAEATEEKWKATEEKNETCLEVRCIYNPFMTPHISIRIARL